jgi:ketosteroid isomerase-like protein
MSPTRLAKLESAIRIVLTFNQAFNRHDVAAMMRLMSDDCVFENTTPAPDGAVYSGKDAVARF